MKFAARDVAKIRLPLLAATVLLVIGILLAWWSWTEAQRAARERDATASRKEQIAQRLRQVRSEEQELKEMTQLFQHWEKSAITGEEKRLEWMETLRALQQELRIPGMNYEFGVQVPLESVQGAAYAWFGSPMRLQLRLLHEGDLLNFLTRLEQEARALVLIRNCRLARLDKAAGEGRESWAQLKADCELQWLTVRRSTGKP